jgi:hypothetical protein
MNNFKANAIFLYVYDIYVLQYMTPISNQITPVSILLIKLLRIHHDSLFDIIYASILLDILYLKESVETKGRCMHGHLIVFGISWIKCALNQISVSNLKVRGFWEFLGIMSIVNQISV